MEIQILGTNIKIYKLNIMSDSKNNKLLQLYNNLLYNLKYKKNFNFYDEGNKIINKVIKI
tara:strand:+ start:672 stop:851 length:180 start_codon:yes stop_codon:yes gene_type:complete